MSDLIIIYYLISLNDYIIMYYRSGLYIYIYKSLILHYVPQHDRTDHIHRHENTTIVPSHKPEDPIESNNMLRPVNTILRSRDMESYKITVVQI